MIRRIVASLALRLALAAGIATLVGALMILMNGLATGQASDICKPGFFSRPAEISCCICSMLVRSTGSSVEPFCDSPGLQSAA
ncbi:MAG: hypothetical protein R6V26_14890 [Roseovarius sp.]